MQALRVRRRHVLLPDTDAGGGRRLRLDARPLAAAMVDGTVVVLARSGRIETYDAQSLEPRRSIEIPGARRLRFVGEQIEVETDDGVRHWDVRTLEEIRAPTGTAPPMSVGMLRPVFDRRVRSVSAIGEEIELSAGRYLALVDLLSSVIDALDDAQRRATTLHLHANHYFVTAEIRAAAAPAVGARDRSALERLGGRAEQRDDHLRIVMPVQ